MSANPVAPAGDTEPQSSDLPSTVPIDLRAHLPYRLAHLSNMMRRATTDCYVRGMKISAREWRVLGMLGLKGSLTPTQLAELTAMDPATITRAGDRLVQLGYCRRIPNDLDNRSLLLTLSPAGHRQCAAIIPKMAGSGDRCRSVFSAGEQALLFELLDRLQRELEGGLLSE